MSNTIEKLYEGKLEPLKLVGKGNGEMRRIENLIERNKLKETLDSDKKEIFEKYVECMDEYLILIGEQAFCEGSCGIHIHLNGADHTPRSIRNFINIIASKNDLLYKSLQIDEVRTKWCKKMDRQLVETMNKKKPATFSQIENIWYAGFCESRNTHYHKSRYHFLNLHSFFHGNHTVELRGFNSTLHAGKIRSYIVLALALNHQALTQQKASTKKNQTENEKFDKSYLNDEVKRSVGK